MASGSLESLQDAVRVLEQAKDSSKGLRLRFRSNTDARNFRQRLYAARDRVRGRARRLYEPEDPMYGKSPYDGLTFFQDPNCQHNLLIRESESMDIEGLEEMEEL